MKALALVAMLMLGSPARAPLPPFADALTQSGIPARLHPEIVRVDCLTGTGTAFRVGPHTLLSVNHVTSQKLCFIGGERVTVANVTGDFSIIKSATDAESWLKIDCGGFVAGREYEAIGFARGLGTLTDVDLTATGRDGNGFSILTGVFTVIPGQSGGPVIDKQTGAVVGTVNVYDMPAGLSGSVPLSGTPLCRG